MYVRLMRKVEQASGGNEVLEAVFEVYHLGRVRVPDGTAFTCHGKVLFKVPDGAFADVMLLNEQGDSVLEWVFRPAGVKPGDTEKIH